MPSARRLMLTLAVALVPLLAAAGASAAPFDPNGFRFPSSSFVVNENVGSAAITITRNNTGQDAQIRYIALGIGVQCGSAQCTAVSPYDFKSVKGMLDFPAGVGSETFNVPIVDHGIDTVPKTIQVSLFGPSTWPGQIGLGNPSTATLTVLEDDPPAVYNPLDPLGLSNDMVNGDPLVGARFFVDHQSEPAMAAHQYRAIGVIAREPGTARFGTFSGPDVGIAVAHYLTRAAAQEPGTVPLLSTYRIVDGHCGHWSDPPSEVASYQNFINRFAAGIGDYRAVLFLEMDSIITSPCLSRAGLAVRIGELNYAIDTLTANCPRLVIYLDAGAADALHARDAANLLKRAGVAKIQGFFLNSTHFDWTSREIRYGEAISRMTGGKHFVINTGENGQGPLVPPDIVHQGLEVLCNPPGRGLGPLPSTHTGYPNVDAFAWTSNPGESGGACVPGAPATGVYWSQYALMLVRNADFKVR